MRGRIAFRAGQRDGVGSILSEPCFGRLRERDGGEGPPFDLASPPAPSAGDRIMLRLESVQSSEAANAHDPDLFRILMTKQQAAVLGHYLVRISGQSPVVPGKRGWFRRYFG